MKQNSYKLITFWQFEAKFKCLGSTYYTVPYTTLEAFRTFLRKETIYPGSAAASGIIWAIKQIMKVRALQGGGNLTPMALMEMGGKSTYYSDDVKRYPLLMSSPHGLFRIHTLLDNQPLLSKDCYRHGVWISVADAKSRGIKDDDIVKVFNDQAEIIMPAYVTSRVVPGTVNIFHGGWYTPSKMKTALMPEGIDTRGAPNLMTHYDEQPLPETILDHEPCKALVQIEKWEGA
jgi:anaerobic selenocysteine-containing dehydrogenase